jgi:hypothetical protein
MRSSKQQFVHNTVQHYHRKMDQATVNKRFVEQLGRCPKFECNFWSGGFLSGGGAKEQDGEVSEITYEGRDFWLNNGPGSLYLAAKRFENNVSTNPEPSEVSDNLPTALYHEDRLVGPIPCSEDEDDAFPYSEAPHTPIRRTSTFTPFDGFEEDRKAGNEPLTTGEIPRLEPISDKENSFSSTDLNSRDRFSQYSNDNESFDESDGMDHLYERIVNTSSLSSSFLTPHAMSLPLRRTPQNSKFSDVKTAKSLNLFVDEYPQTGFFSLLDSLQSNTNIQRIVIFRKREMRSRTLEDMDNLFHVIRILNESLVELVLWNFLPEDLSSLCLGITHHPTIGFLQFHMEYGTLDQKSVQTIASMPSLASLEVDVHESFPVWSLLESDSLVLLGVVSDRFEFAPHDVLRLAGRIRTNCVLRVLDLEPRIPSWCIGAVMASLRFSHTSKLETFRFSCSNGNNEEQGDLCMAEVLKTIEYETPLKALWNHSRGSFSVSEEVRRKTLAAVRRNPSLEHFHLFAETERFHVFAAGEE